MRKVELSPSILTTNYDCFSDTLKIIDQMGGKYVHFDVMDGKFVKEKTLPLDTLKKLCEQSDCINDVHIMVNNPLEVAKDYIDAGADILTFHYEACPSKDYLLKTINLIKSLNCKVGISIKPSTPVSVLKEFINLPDLVLIMSVEPGKGGQSFIKESVNKISDLRKMIDNSKSGCLISVDGGINDITAPLVIKAGADILVAGSYIFDHGDSVNKGKGLLKND